MKELLTINMAFWVGVCIVCICSSCTKNESPYYDYANKVKIFDGTALDYLQTQDKGTFDSLLVVLDRLPALKDTLSQREVTLFAPVNENFAAAVKYLNNKRKADNKSMLYLRDMDLTELDDILCKYIIRAKRSTADYPKDLDGVFVASIRTNYPMHIRYQKLSSAGFVEGGASILNFSNPFGSSFTNDWVTTRANTVNIQTDNAIINILEPIHNFGFNDFTNRLDK